MPRFAFGLAVLASIFVAETGPVSAQQLIESYKAELSEADHFSSAGTRLTTAAAIIRQDRANFHRFSLRDRFDQDDLFFADQANREILERLIEGGTSEPDALIRIIHGTPKVRVDTYRGPYGPYVNVTIID